MNCLRAFLLSAIYLTALPSIGAQQLSTAAPAVSPRMTNDDVIALSGANLGDEIVIAKINAAVVPSFDTSVSGLRALKAAGISTAVIKAMIAPTPALPQPSSPNPLIQGDPDSPKSPHSPGIYAFSLGSDGKNHLAKLAQVYAKEVKMTQVFMGYKYIADVDAPHASVELAGADIEFYAYLGNDKATGAVLVRELSLIQFTVKKKEREAVIARVKITGAKPGADQKATEGFTSSEIVPGVYKLTLMKPLPMGEFAFYQAGTFQAGGAEQDGGSYFEFGVQAVHP